MASSSENGRRWIRWSLCAAAFAAVVNSAGCGMSGTGKREYISQPVQNIDPPAGAATAEDFAPPDHPGVMDTGAMETGVRNTGAAETGTPPGESAMAPKIDEFGELDGVPRPQSRRAGSENSYQQHTWIDEGYDGDVSTDPKGQYLLFSSTRNSEHPSIYLQKTDGLAVIQLTSNESASDAYPVFSPDGKQIAFCSTRAGNWDIYTMDTDGRHIVQITSSPAQEIHPSFSPDGTRLTYSALSNRSGQWELWTVNLTTGEKRMIGPGLFPCWSPSREKNQIAFQKPRARGSRWFTLWTLDLQDEEARRITEVAVSANAAIVSPAWSPDGKRLTFSTIVDPAHSSGGKPNGQQDVWTINADGSDRHRITDGNGTCATPCWASDGRIYFVSNRGGNDCIWSARTDAAPLATASVDTKEELKN